MLVLLLLVAATVFFFVFREGGTSGEGSANGAATAGKGAVRVETGEDLLDVVGQGGALSAFESRPVTEDGIEVQSVVCECERSPRRDDCNESQAVAAMEIAALTLMSSCSSTRRHERCIILCEVTGRLPSGLRKNGRSRSYRVPPSVPERAADKLARIMNVSESCVQTPGRRLRLDP